MIDQLVNSNDHEVKKIRKRLNFHIVPVVNPDGYTYTQSLPEHRFWRKTRSEKSAIKPDSKSHRRCSGVDGNRNYGYYWGGQAFKI